MRIIAGRLKSRILRMPKAAKIRPTSQMVKKAIFDILGEEIKGSSFLELFAGSGSVGIEALSRGADQAIFVENNRKCICAIEKNLKVLGIVYNYGLAGEVDKNETSVRLLPLEAEKALEVLYHKKYRFDFVFLDPPYYQNKLKNHLIKMCQYDILENHSLVIAEHSKHKSLPNMLAALTLITSKKYGDSVLSFYQKEAKI